MTEAYILSFAQNAIIVAVILVGPILLVSLLIGSLISMIQAATQINEVTLTFIPKIIGIGLVVAFLGSWMVQNLISFTTNVFVNLPSMPR
ncbi:MAG: flagellar biosynthesis protein FliQ [Anaerolineales bacterium]|nr:flagellar biosynthesis protein FliQ [Anaerolineales bacterium]